MAKKKSEITPEQVDCILNKIFRKFSVCDIKELSKFSSELKNYITGAKDEFEKFLELDDGTIGQKQRPWQIEYLNNVENEFAALTLLANAYMERAHVQEKEQERKNKHKEHSDDNEEK